VIAIVIAGRNDDHGGDFRGRFMSAARFNDHVLTEAGIPHRFVFVEWNSPSASGEMSRDFVGRFPEATAYVCGPAWHRHVCDNPHMVFMEFFAKNVGIQRSKDPVILCTNSDVLFGRDVIAILKEWRNMADSVLYRTVGRFDVRSAVTYDTADQLDENVVDRCHATAPAYTDGSGDFQCATKTTWNQLGGFDENIRWAKIHKDARLCHQMLALGGKVVARGACFHRRHEDSYLRSPLRKKRIAPWGLEYNPRKHLPYVNDSGWGLRDVSESRPLGSGIMELRPRIPLRDKMPNQIIKGAPW
jgi:hypothetical protein